MAQLGMYFELLNYTYGLYKKKGGDEHAWQRVK